MRAAASAAPAPQSGAVRRRAAALGAIPASSARVSTCAVGAACRAAHAPRGRRGAATPPRPAPAPQRRRCRGKKVLRAAAAALALCSAGRRCPPALSPPRASVGFGGGARRLRRPLRCSVCAPSARRLCPPLGAPSLLLAAALASPAGRRGSPRAACARLSARSRPPPPPFRLASPVGSASPCQPRALRRARRRPLARRGAQAAARRRRLRVAPRPPAKFRARTRARAIPASGVSRAAVAAQRVARPHAACSAA